MSAENARSDFIKFSHCALNALDLYDEKSGLVQYLFGPKRSIGDVIQRACEDESQQNEIRDTILATINGIYMDLLKDCEKISETGIQHELFRKLALRMDILQDIDLAYQKVANLKHPQIDEYFEAAKSEVNRTYERAKTSPMWKRVLTPAMLEYYLNIGENVDNNSKNSLKTSPEDAQFYARDDGVVTSLAHEKALNDTDRKKRGFVSKLEQILINYQNKREDSRVLREFLERLEIWEGWQLDGYEAARLTDGLMNIWDTALDSKFDKQHRHLFTEILRKFYLILTNEKKHVFATKILAKYRSLGKILPNLENFIENYQTKLTECLNALPADHQQINANPEDFERVRQNLGWYLLVTPATTLHQMMSQCITVKSLVPAVIKVCKSVPELFKYDVILTTTTANFSGHFDAEPLVICILKRIISLGRTSWATSGEEWDNLAYLAMAFTKRAVAKNGESEIPLLESFELIQLAKKEIVNKQSAQAVESFAKLLSRLLANNSNNKLNANFEFSTILGQKNMPKNMLAAPELIFLLHDLLVENDTKETAEYCRETLKSLAGRMADVRFEEKTSKFFEQRFNSSGWWVKYAIFAWFHASLGDLKRQIPSGLYISIPDAIKDRFEQIISSDYQSSAAECYLKSIFELGFFDIDLAIEQLNYGFDKKLEDADCLEKMALALVDCYGKRLAKKRSGAVDLTKLIKAMLNILEPSKSFKKLEIWTASMYEAIKDIDYLLVMAKAVKIAFERQHAMSYRDTTGIAEKSFDEILTAPQIAQQLISIYCQAARKHIETEIEETQQLRTEARKVIFESTDTINEGWKLKLKLERKEQKQMQQLTSIFNESCSFTRQMREIPICLQQLLTLIAQQMLQVQDFATNRCLDEVLTEKTKVELVYAFTSQLPPVGIPPPPSPIENVKKVEQNQQIAHVPPTFVENAMFNGAASTSKQGAMRRYSEDENGPRYSTATHQNPNPNRNNYNRSWVKGSRSNPNQQHKRVSDPHNLPPAERQEFVNRSRRNNHHNQNQRNRQTSMNNQYNEQSENEFVNEIYSNFDNFQHKEHLHHHQQQQYSPRSENRYSSTYSEGAQAAIDNLTSEKLHAVLERTAAEKAAPKARPAYSGRGGRGRQN